MKIMPVLLMNLALVVGGIVIYDQLRAEAPSTTYEAGGIDSVTVANMTDRIRALEDRSPGLKATGLDPNLLARLERLEAKLAIPLPAAPRGEAAGEEPGATTTEGGFALPDLAEGEKPADADVQRFRRMMDAAEELRREERERERLLAQLKDLDITLNPQQTEKLVEATRAYREKIGEVWRNAFQTPRAQEGDREAAREAARVGMETLREEFAVTINKFLPSGDAQKIVENLGRVGGRGFGNMPGGPGGPATGATRRGR